jgi:hypothetical protein
VEINRGEMEEFVEVRGLMSAIGRESRGREASREERGNEEGTTQFIDKIMERMSL